MNIINMESIRKLGNFNFQWTKTLYQNNLSHIEFFSTLFKGYLLVICNNPKDNFLWEPVKIDLNFTGIVKTHVKFHG